MNKYHDDDDVINVHPSVSQLAHCFRAQIHEWNPSDSPTNLHDDVHGTACGGMF